jgi:hypothetical protein
MPKRALTFGCMGLAFVLWMLFSLWSGAIWSRRGVVIYRASEPFQFYAWIFFYTLLATLFIGVEVFFYLYPEFSLVPVARDSAD